MGVILWGNRCLLGCHVIEREKPRRPPDIMPHLFTFAQLFVAPFEIFTALLCSFFRALTAIFFFSVTSNGKLIGCEISFGGK